MSGPRFVTLEGIDGAGKTTARDYLADQLKARGIPAIVTREPGGTETGEAIRDLLKGTEGEAPQPDTETLLVFAARAEHLARVVRPGLERGYWVLCDRFTDATYAYQGGGWGVPFPRIELLEEWVQQGLQPHRTLFLDIPVAEGLRRRSAQGRPDDRFEGEGDAFLERVRKVYQERARSQPERIVRIDAGRDWPEVTRSLDDWLERELAGEADDD